MNIENIKLTERNHAQYDIWYDYIYLKFQDRQMQRDKKENNGCQGLAERGVKID